MDNEKIDYEFNIDLGMNEGTNGLENEPDLEIPEPPKIIKKDSDSKIIKEKPNKEDKDLLEFKRFYEDGQQELKIVKDKIGKLLKITPIVLFITLAVFGLLIALKTSIVWIFIYVIIAIPLTLGNILVSIIKLYMEKTKIKNRLLKKLSSIVIIGNWFMPNKKIKQVCFRCTRNYINFSNGHYFVNESVIWFDDMNFPNIFYFFGIPNPLNLNFTYWLNKFYDNTRINLDKIARGEMTQSLFDEQNNEIDVSYQSESIRAYRSDKLLQELHSSTTMVIMGIVILLSIIIIILCVLILVKNPVVVQQTAQTGQTAIANLPK